MTDTHERPTIEQVRPELDDAIGRALRSDGTDKVVVRVRDRPVMAGRRAGRARRRPHCAGLVMDGGSPASRPTDASAS
jgi:hypothetical protein